MTIESHSIWERSAESLTRITPEVLPLADCDTFRHSPSAVLFSAELIGYHQLRGEAAFGIDA